MVTRQVGANGVIRFIGHLGAVSLERLRPGVILLTYVGDIDADFYDPMIVEMEQELRLARIDEQSLTILVDGWDLKGIDSNFRERWMQWLTEHKGEIAAVLGLIRSKLVMMATSVMSMFVGGSLIRTYADRYSFDAAVTEALPDLDRRWLSGTEASLTL